jgi:hypothetical protein
MFTANLTQKRKHCYDPLFFKPLATALSLTFAAGALPALAETPMITSTNGIAIYPEGYQGTPVRAADEDPFLSPSNSALILIDYQPPILTGRSSPA